MRLTKSMRVALMSIHFNRWDEALWVEGVSPGPHKINEGGIHFHRWGEAFWVEGVSPAWASQNQ